MDYFFYIQSYIPTFFLRLAIRLYIFADYYDSANKNHIKNNIGINETNNNNKIAVLTEKANEQHYEVPTDFFKLHLGGKLKYSSCEKMTGDVSIDIIEENTLRKYQDYLKLDNIKDGGCILEMGCGWGSLSLYNAQLFPNLKFVCFSNSKTQIEYINSMINFHSINNLTAIVEDYNDFCSSESNIKQQYDRIVAIETIEHCRNIKSIFKSINIRLKYDGYAFVQSLVKQNSSYIMSDKTWMGRNFFSGGQILSIQSYLHYNDDMIIRKMIPRNGKEYSVTLDLWLEQLEKQKNNIISKYGNKLYEKFRMFYIMSSEAFRSINGNNYMTCYYILEKR